MVVPGHERGLMFRRDILQECCSESFFLSCYRLDYSGMIDAGCMCWAIECRDVGKPNFSRPYSARTAGCRIEPRPRVSIH